MERIRGEGGEIDFGGMEVLAVSLSTLSAMVHSILSDIISQVVILTITAPSSDRGSA